jgi:hypothetical protein
MLCRLGFIEHKYGENIMAKGSKPSAKGGYKTPVKEDAFKASGQEETIISGKDGGKIDFFYILAGGGVLIGVILIIFIIFRYVFHMV